jgi:uncharacterized RDD family membrane protein YckC
MNHCGTIPAVATREYAGLWPRFLALLLDLVLLSAVFFPVTRIVKGTWLMTAADHRWSRGLFISDPLCLVFLAAMFFYFVFLEGLAGGTVGKWLVHLRVVGVQGPGVGLQRALLRNLLRIVDGLPTLGILGAVLIAMSNERARFGDRVAQTRVIRARRGERGR